MSRWLRAVVAGALALLAGLAPVASSMAAYRKIPRQLRPAGIGRDRESHRLRRSGLPEPVTGLTPACGRAPSVPVTRERILVAAHDLVYKQDWQKDQAAVVARLEGEFKYPFIAKPADDGCSSAVKKIKNRAELEKLGVKGLD